MARARNGLPGWLAPIAGPILGALLGLEAFAEGENVKLPVLIGTATGLVAGLLVWALDALKGREEEETRSGRRTEKRPRADDETDERIQPRKWGRSRREDGA